jgi:hypothetical protein
MPELPVSSEMVEFAVNVARATINDKLEWEVTADEDVVLASLGGPYTAKLERVSRRDDNEDYYPDYELALIKGRDELFRLDGEMLSGTSFAESVGSDQYSHPILRNMWTRAILKAKKVTEDLIEVNRLLLTKLGPAAAIEEDDEVPF